MNTALESLLAVYRLWSTWTDAESEAIQQEDWARVEECQRQKSLLQRQIVREEERLGPADLTGGSGQRELGQLLEKLHCQERFNQDQLRRKRVHAEQQRTQAQIAGRTLRRVHGAYVPSRVAGWQSYS